MYQNYIIIQQIIGKFIYQNVFVLLKGWVGFTLLSEMPTYLTDVLGFNLESAGILCVFPYLALLISTLFFGRMFETLERDYQWKASESSFLHMPFKLNY